MAKLCDKCYLYISMKTGKAFLRYDLEHSDFWLMSLDDNEGFSDIVMTEDEAKKEYFIIKNQKTILQYLCIREETKKEGD